MTATISGVFAGRDGLLDAIETLKGKGHMALDVMMPVPDHEVLDALPIPPTPVNWLFSLAGGLFGVGLGFMFPAWAHGLSFVNEVVPASINGGGFGQITGGKPLVSWPPFFVPGFEMMVLFTGILTFLGVVVLCGLPQRHGDPHFDDRATEDHYVLIVTTAPESSAEVARILAAAGAEVK
ncbi:MAG: DUF3341 domain-containing protein [Candidatus Sumerlaeia bacterium]|nr:DUF3341 domain-containing protein [Candidatus Sumerlaeia bacterium]